MKVHWTKLLALDVQKVQDKWKQQLSNYTYDKKSDIKSYRLANRQTDLLCILEILCSSVLTYNCHLKCHWEHL